MSKPMPKLDEHGRAASPVVPAGQPIIVVVFGASGDLAKKKTYPALFALYKHNFLPKDAKIIGYARSKMDDKDLRKRVQESIKTKNDQDKATLEKFLDICHYMSGQYDQSEDFQKLDSFMEKFEQQSSSKSKHRIFYMALPPSAFISVATQLKKNCYPEQQDQSWARLIVEKPFGKDLESSRELARALAQTWKETELYRIDHYLGKEMVKSLISLRFSNMFFSALWNRMAIHNVQITFKEKFGTEGRGGYFDEFGIVRDVMQNHLLQILTLIAMERPISLNADDVRNEKVKILRSINPLQLNDMLLAQYTKSEDGSKPGYLDDETVPKGSKTPTYAAAVFYINNERWDGVPFIIRCGKALDVSKAEVRIQFCDVPGNSMFPSSLSRNELVIRVSPDEAVYMKMNTKEPGLSSNQIVSELDLSYNTRYSEKRIPEAYETLILDALRGDQSNFVRDDELDAAWAIFTPVLHAIDEGKAEPIKYPFGARAPDGLSKWLDRFGVLRDRQKYSWQAPAKM